jgi:hypothetical protein
MRTLFFSSWISMVGVAVAYGRPASPVSSSAEVAALKARQQDLKIELQGLAARLDATDSCSAMPALRDRHRRLTAEAAAAADDRALRRVVDATRKLTAEVDERLAKCQVALVAGQPAASTPAPPGPPSPENTPKERSPGVSTGAAMDAAAQPSSRPLPPGGEGGRPTAVDLRQLRIEMLAALLISAAIAFAAGWLAGRRAAIRYLVRAGLW